MDYNLRNAIQTAVPRVGRRRSLGVRRRLFGDERTSHLPVGPAVDSDGDHDTTDAADDHLDEG